MYSLTNAIVVVLIGILFWLRYYTNLRHKKLPPGPMPLPIIGSLHLLGKLPHRTLGKLSQVYGPIMSIRLGSIPCVVLSSPDAAKLFIGSHDDVFDSRPKLQASENISYGKGITFSSYGPYLRDVKKFCKVELLSTSKINSFGMMRREEVGLMLEELKASSTSRKIVNLRETVGVLLEHITCRMIFGKRLDEGFVFKSIIDNCAKVIGTFNLGDFVPVLAPFDLQGLAKRSKWLSKDLDEMFEVLIHEHEQRNLTAKGQNIDRNNFIDKLLSLNKDDTNNHNDLSNIIDRSSIKAILLDMVAGGIDTTTTCIEWILSVLITHPRVMKKLQKELKNVVGDKLVVEEEDLPKLTYLHMVVKETIRLYPVAPFLFPRESTEDIVINGYDIPKNTRILVNYWAFGRDPKVWSDNCEKFLPERFLDSEIHFRGRDFKLIQFSIGRRACPGMNSALLHIGLVVSNMVHLFDWELPDGMSANEMDMNENFGLASSKAKPLEAIPMYRTFENESIFNGRV